MKPKIIDNELIADDIVNHDDVEQLDENDLSELASTVTPEQNEKPEEKQLEKKVTESAPTEKLQESESMTEGDQVRVLVSIPLLRIQYTHLKRKLQPKASKLGPTHSEQQYECSFVYETPEKNIKKDTANLNAIFEHATPL